MNAEFGKISEVIHAYTAATLDPHRRRDANLIKQACEIVRRHEGDESLCTPIDPGDAEPGMAICFTYDRPQANEPWRFGIVHGRRGEGNWVVFTLNVKKDLRKGKVGPGFRCYHMDSMNHVCRINLHAYDPKNGAGAGTKRATEKKA